MLNRLYLKGSHSAKMVGIISVLMLSGCTTLEPDYKQPKSPVPDHWNTKQNQGQGSQAAADIGWKSYFRNTDMQQLIALALANNRDFRISSLNVIKAQRQLDIQGAALLPNIDFSSTETAAHLPKGLWNTSPTTGETYHTNTAEVGISSWELDFFGRLRSLKHEALNEYLAQVATQRSDQISLVADVAQAYLQLCAYRSLEKMAISTMKSDMATFKIHQDNMRNGLSPGSTLDTAQMPVSEAQAQVSEYQREVAQAYDSLQLLLGTHVPQHIVDNAYLENVEFFQPLPAGLPSELLVHRPDIIAAEETLKASNANIGAARAAFFPSISLTAEAGNESGQLHRLFNTNQGVWTFAPSINIPIFNWGTNQDNLDIAKIEKRSDIASYEKAIQTAFQEVSDALAARSAYADELAARETDQQASQRFYNSAQELYHNGIDNYLNTLEAERSLLSARSNTITARLAALNQQVTLYKVLGGGWKE